MRGTYIGGFPEPERAIWGTPEALRVLRGKPRCTESSVAWKTGCVEDRLRGRPVRASLPRAKITCRQLDLTIIN